tara:strand:+ start:2259 stop:3359 length:1101 start_codon:yes stop_codon:yes gene_type:complete
MNFLWRYLLVTALILICTVLSVDAQVVLERVSITERADGQGVVIRNHLSMMPDSFQVIQPTENRIQFILYSEGIEGEDFIEAELTDEIEQVEYFIGAGFFAYEITLEEGVFYLGNAYPDVNQTDVLLSLERVQATDLAGVLEPGLQLFEGRPIADEEESETEPAGRSPDAEDAVDVEINRVKSTFGIKAGLTSADIYGTGYGRNPRNGSVFAISAVINFPTYLPYDLSLGLETGVYFTQKGFTDITSTKFTGIETEFDYVEIPVLAKLKYREQNRFSPHIVLGPYIGFLANAENVRENGERIDLDEFTSAVDIGGLAGVGLDIRLGNYIVDLQIRQSIGFKTLFNEVTFNDEEKLRQLSLIIGLRF